MLEYLRNAADKPVAKVLMFVLIFSFVGWGAAEWIFGGVSRDTTLIHVGNADVSVQQFNNERSRQLSSMSKEEQRSAYTDPAKAAELTKNVMSSLTVNQLALNRAKDLGFVVSDKRIAEEIKSNEQFQINGKFVPWMYDMVVQNAGVSEQDIIDSLRGDIMRQMAVGASRVPLNVSDFAVDALYNARYTKRNIDYSTVKFSDFKVAEPSDEDLRVYYAQNPVIVPESRSVSYVFLAADMNKPDEYDAGFKQAQLIEDMIISGDSLKEAADKHNAKFVQISDVKRGEKTSDKILNDDLIAKAFSMDSGVESELLELKDGFVILRVDSIVAQHNADFDDVKKSLTGDWKKSEQRKAAYVATNEKLSALKDGQKTVKDMKHALVSRTDGAELEVLNAAFAGANNDNVIVEGKDAFYVLHIGDDVAPKADEKSREAIRKELQKMSANYVSDDYSHFLKRHYPVRVNEKVFDRFIAK